MKYKQQLYFIISFIGLRLLTLVLYAFFQPKQAGPYTPYILFLYTLFDLLIICYLYRFVKMIKKQNFSLTATVLVVIGSISNLAINLIFPSTVNDLSFVQIQFVLTISQFIHAAAMFVLAVQLIRNKAVGSTSKLLSLTGWSYIIVFILSIGITFLYIMLDYFPDYISYVIKLGPSLPLLAMLVLYLNEAKQGSLNNYYKSSQIIDSEL